MSMPLDALCQRIHPSKTSLLLGAGASIPSGAPSGSELARKLWETLTGGSAQSEDLIETASILERRYSRKELVEGVVGILRPLKPTGGLLGLPALGWEALFTTNFDELAEMAYKKANIPLTRIRSNFDLSYQESSTDTRLYKLHGCISQDRALGQKGSMLLTEQDYEDFSQYRQSLFSLLETNLLTGDVLVIGQSLADRHLNDLIKRVLKYKFQGAPGNIYVLIYDKDDLRAPLIEDRGAKVAFAGIDDFVHAMTTGSLAAGRAEHSPESELPLSLVSVVDDVAHARSLEPNVLRMFNGGPATYADIRVNATFERSQQSLQIDRLANGGLDCLTIVGAAGVGKTTFARQLLHQLSQQGFLAFEHRNDFPFMSAPWLAFEADLRTKGRHAVLFLDECTRYLRQANLLIDHLANIENPAVVVVLTANAAQWAPRLKTPNIYSSGSVLELSQLEDPDLHALINLVDYTKGISDLVDSEFKTLTRERQFARLRDRCSADMFVCLRNIFANDSLDQILLAEYAELDGGAQEYYRYIAALESVGMRVHRQLVMRMLNLRADAVAAVLSSLSGIVDEFDIKASEGIYGWATRHLVIARIITDYKFASLDELDELFTRIVDNINPAVRTELQSIRDLCDTEFGIGRLAEPAVRKKLYRRLIEIAPAERIPWHRLIRELLLEANFEEASYVIRDATAAVGADGPIDRYKVRLLVARSEATPGLATSDRVALLRQAYELAANNTDRHKADKHAYRVLCEVAMKLASKTDSPYILDEAIAKMRDAADSILDPDLDRELRHFEGVRARL